MRAPFSYSSSDSTPYPELVLGDGSMPYQTFDTLRMPWLPTNGMTDKKGRRIFTPYHPQYRHVSLHELAHVKWSPEAMPKPDYDVRVYQAVEDARINLGLDRIGRRLELSSEDREYVGRLLDSDLARDDVGAVVLRTIASMGTNAVTDLSAHLAGKKHEALLHSLIADVRARLANGAARRKAPVASQKLAIRIGRDVARVLEDNGLLPHGEPGGVHLGCVFGACSHTGRAAEGLLLGGIHAEFGDGGSVEPGELEITEAPLVERVERRGSFGGRHWRPATEGCVVAYVHRAALDGAVYRRAVRRAGCTLLIDVSGSMSLDTEDLSHVLAAAPGKPLIGIYGGHGDRGELRIVARNGRRAAASDLAPPGAGNIVDIPCLEWLAKQRAPRIWVSDGGVTGCNDQGSQELRREAGKICRRARIQRVESVEEVGKLVSR